MARDIKLSLKLEPPSREYIFGWSGAIHKPSNSW